MTPPFSPHLGGFDLAMKLWASRLWVPKSGTICGTKIWNQKSERPGCIDGWASSAYPNVFLVDRIVARNSWGHASGTRIRYRQPTCTRLRGVWWACENNAPAPFARFLAFSMQSSLALIPKHLNITFENSTEKKYIPTISSN